MQHMARKLKKACPMWKIIAGFEMIICKKTRSRVSIAYFGDGSKRREKEKYP